MFKNLDPGQVVATFKGVNIVGFNDGSFIEVERSEDAFSMHVGATGDVTRVRNRNRTGAVTFTLIQASPTNDLLSAIALDDELNGTGYGPLIIKDLLGGTMYRATEAWIRKYPKGDHAKDATSRQWVIDCSELKMNIGGSVV